MKSSIIAAMLGSGIFNETFREISDAENLNKTQPLQRIYDPRPIPNYSEHNNAVETRQARRQRERKEGKN